MKPSRTAFAALAFFVHIGVGFAQTSAESAQLRYEEGLRLFDQRAYERALAEFRASLVLYSSPNTFLGIARALRELGRLDEAVQMFERAVHEAGTQPTTGPQSFAATGETATAEARALAPRVGRVSVTVRASDATLRMRVGDRESAVQDRFALLVVMPGRVPIDIDAAGYQPWHRDIDVAAGQLTSFDVSLERLPIPPPRPAPSAPAPVVIIAPSHTATIGWATLGAGGIGLVFAGAFAATANARAGELAICMNCRNRDALAQEGQTWESLTNFSLGIGITALVAGGAVLFFGRPQRVAGVRAVFTGNAVLLRGWF